MSSVTWYLEGSFLKVTPAHFVFSNDGLRALDRGIYINVCEAIYIFHTLKFKLSWSHITLHKRLTFDRSFILARKNWQKEADHHSSRFAPLDFLLTCNKVSKNEKYASLKFSSDFVIFYDAVMMHFIPGKICKFYLLLLCVSADLFYMTWISIGFVKYETRLHLT